MSIYDAIANPMVPNIAQATMQGQQTRLQQEQANQQAQLFPLQLQAAEQSVEKGDLEIEALRNPPRDYAREAQRLDLFRSRATAVTDLLSPIADMDPEQQWAYFAENAPLIQSLLPEGTELPQSPQELPHFSRSISLLAETTGDAHGSVREIQRLRLEGKDDEADLMEGALEQGFRDKMVPKIGQQVQFPNGDVVLIQDQATLDRAIAARAVPVSTVQREEVGGPGDFSTPTQEAQYTQTVATTRTVLDGLDRLEQQITEGGANIVGVMGMGTRFLDTAAAQLSTLSESSGAFGEINGRRVPLERLRDSSRYVETLSSVFGETAARSAAFRSNMTDTAFLLALQANPDGRISDPDVRHQIQRLGGDTGSPTQILATLQEVRRATLARFVRTAESLGQPIPEWARQSGTVNTNGMRRQDAPSPTDIAARYERLRRRVNPDGG